MNDQISDLTAILLCGGKGERLRPFTENLPKAMVPLNGQPLLQHLLGYLSNSGVSRFVVCVGYKPETIEAFVREQDSLAGQIVCVNSGDVSMTDRILDARKHVRGRALVCYGDTLANVDLASLLHQHEQSGALATLTVYPLQSPFGIVQFDESKRVSSFQEKPQLPHWINIGFVICEPEAFSFLSPGSDLPQFLSALADAGKLYTHTHTGSHLTVNTEKDRALAENEIEFFTYMDGRAK